MTRLQEIEAIQAEVNYYRDSVALLRARLYRRGAGDTPRLEELQRRLASAQARLRAARAEPPPARTTDSDRASAESHAASGGGGVVAHRADGELGR